MEKFTQRNGNATGCPRQWEGKGREKGKPAHDFKAKYCRINLANKKLFDLRSAEGRIRLLFCWLFSRLFEFYRFWGFFLRALCVIVQSGSTNWPPTLLPRLPRGISQLIVCLTLEWCVHFISISQRSLSFAVSNRYRYAQQPQTIRNWTGNCFPFTEDEDFHLPYISICDV